MMGLWGERGVVGKKKPGQCFKVLKEISTTTGGGGKTKGKRGRKEIKSQG